MQTEDSGKRSGLSMQVAASDPSSRSPLDATPSPDGRVVYYTAVGQMDDGTPSASVFKVPAAGGTVERISTGDPLGSPTSIDVSFDGSTLFLADAGAASGGAVLSLSADGGTASVLSGTEGYGPRGLVVQKVRGEERVFFTGTDPSTGERGVFSTTPGGGGVTVIGSGSPFSDPGGVAVTERGDVYVADSFADGGQSAVLRVAKGKTDVFASGIGVGFPAGITLTQDEATLAVSGLDPALHSDVVYFVDVASKDITTLTDTVSAFHEAAGLHRAHEKDVFAWADSTANGPGTVYLLQH